MCLSDGSYNTQGGRLFICDWDCVGYLEVSVGSDELLDRGGGGLPRHAPQVQGKQDHGDHLLKSNLFQMITSGRWSSSMKSYLILNKYTTPWTREFA